LTGPAYYVSFFNFSDLGLFVVRDSVACDREIGKILDLGGVGAVICRSCGGWAIGFPITQAIEVEEADIPKRCYVAIVSLRELKSLDRR
jgi:hypothetical protein